LFNTITGSGVQVYLLDIIYNTIGLNSVYTFNIRTEGANNLALFVGYQVNYVSGSTTVNDDLLISANNVVTTSGINLSVNAPSIKVENFLKGVMLMFNMTIYSIKENEYWLEPLDDWYSKGAVVDISQHTDVTSIEMERMPLYKKIQFKFQESECFLNKNFSQTYNRSYGDTSYQYNYDGGEFTIDVPFENLLQQKFTSTDLQVGYSLNNSFSPYIPKPVLLYQYENQTTNFKYKNDGSGHSTITSYTPFGQDLAFNNSDVTLNFAPETSTLLNYPIQNTQFSQYYFSYLYNLYNLKQRLFNVKTNLPTSLLTNIQLNDRLVIRDKRYIINEMQCNLNTGDVDFQLLLDFRPIVNSTNPNPTVSTEGGVVLYAINLPKNAVEASFSCSNTDVSFNEDDITESKVIKITLPSGEAGTVYTIVVAYTYSDGSKTIETFYIIQQ